MLHSSLCLLEKRYTCQDGSSMNQGFIILSMVDKDEDKEFILATTHLKAKNGTENVDTRCLQVPPSALVHLQPGKL